MANMSFQEKGGFYYDIVPYIDFEWVFSSSYDSFDLNIYYEGSLYETITGITGTEYKNYYYDLSKNEQKYTWTVTANYGGCSKTSTEKYFSFDGPC